MKIGYKISSRISHWILMCLLPTFCWAQQNSPLVGLWAGTSKYKFEQDEPLQFEIKKISTDGNIVASVKIGNNEKVSLKGHFISKSYFVFKGNFEGEIKMWIHLSSSSVYLKGGRFLDDYVPDITYIVTKELTNIQKSVLAKLSINDLKISPIAFNDQNKNLELDNHESVCMEFLISNQQYSTLSDLNFQIWAKSNGTFKMLEKGRIDYFERNHKCGISFSFNFEKDKNIDSLHFFIDFIYPYDTTTRFLFSKRVSNNDYFESDEAIINNKKITTLLPGEYLHETQFSLTIKIQNDNTYSTFNDSIVVSRGQWTLLTGYSATCVLGSYLKFSETHSVSKQLNILSGYKSNKLFVANERNPKYPMLTLAFDPEGTISKQLFTGNGFSSGKYSLVNWIKFNSNIITDSSYNMFRHFISGYWGDGTFCFLFDEKGRAYYGKKGNLLDKGRWYWDSQCNWGGCQEILLVCIESEHPLRMAIPCKIEYTRDPNTIKLINLDESKRYTDFSTIQLTRGLGTEYFEDKEYEKVYFQSPYEVLLRAIIFIDEHRILECTACKGTGTSIYDRQSCNVCGGSGSIMKKDIRN